MPQIKDAKPEVSVRLFKTISRTTVDGKAAASARYQGKDSSIDLTPFLADGSAVRTTKSVREPAGGFTLTFADKSHSGFFSPDLESVYGLVEPMDGVEIRMWGGLGPRPRVLPIIMRGFVSNVQRSQAMGENGKPIRTVTIAGQDYGKIWQMFQIIHLAAYSQAVALLTTYSIWEQFKIKAENAMHAGDMVKQTVEKIINPFLKEMLPEHWEMPKEIKADIQVRRGNISNSWQQHEGSLYSMLIEHTDVPTWNELYIEDREDGVYAVYRPVPALKLSGKDVQARKIQPDAPDPVYVRVEDGDMQSQSVERSDAGVANFYWVNNTKYDLIDEIQRKLQSIPKDDKKVNQADYPNSAVKFYGTRPLYQSTQMTGDDVKTQASGQTEGDLESNRTKVLSWIDQRRLELVEMNKDNVVLERGSARVKGGQMRAVAGSDAMKAGDYARFIMGRLEWDAYCVQIDHEFLPFSGYTQTLSFERGEGFAKRVGLESGAWLTEQASRV